MSLLPSVLSGSLVFPFILNWCSCCRFRILLIAAVLSLRSAAVGIAVSRLLSSTYCILFKVVFGLLNYRKKGFWANSSPENGTPSFFRTT